MISDILKRIFYPDDFGCIVCDERGVHRKNHANAVICDDCIAKIHKVGNVTCAVCGRKVGSENSLCEACAEHEFAFDRAYSVYCYDGAVRDIVHKFKYAGAMWLADFGGKAMASEHDLSENNIGYVTFVPMYKKKQKSRGYNQAELLARKFSHYTKLECIDALERLKNTTPQSHLDKEERRKNIEDAIGINVRHENLIKNKNILVIDDILTTGSSLNECAKVLKKHGAANVYGYCLCSVSDSKEKLH